MNTALRLRTSPKIYHYSFHWCKKALNNFKRLSFLFDKKIKVLDIGCGEKVYSGFFSRAEYIGVDIDKDNKLADVYASIDNLPFNDLEFDLVICSEVLEHVEDLPRAIFEIKRVLKKGGYIYISTPISFPYHGVPFDYQRLTRFYFEKSFSDYIFLSISESNTIASTPLLVLNIIFHKVFPVYISVLFYICINSFVYFIDAVLSLVLKIKTKNNRKLFNFLYGLPIDLSLIMKKNA